MRQLRALLWKEWRQMMLLFVACAIGCVVSLGLARIAEITQRQPGGELVSLVALVFCAFVVALFPSAIVAGERRSRELGFLRALPVSPAKLLLAKLLIVLALCGALLIWAGVVTSVLKWGLLLPDSSDSAVIAWLVCLLICCCLFVSAGVRHPLVAMIVGPAVAFAFASASVFLWPFRLLPLRQPRMDPAWLGSLLAALPHLLLFLALVGLALRLLSRRVEGPRSAWAAGWAVARPLMLLAGVLLTAHIAWFLTCALTLTPKPGNMSNLVASPDGRHIAFTCSGRLDQGYHAIEQHPGVLDVDSGRAVLLDRFSSGWPDRHMRHMDLPGKGCWSPDGRFLSLLLSRDWWVPYDVRRDAWRLPDSSPIRIILERLPYWSQQRPFIYEVPARSGTPGAKFPIPAINYVSWTEDNKLLGAVERKSHESWRWLSYDPVRKSSTPFLLPGSDRVPGRELHALPLEGAWVSVVGRTVYLYRSATDDWLGYDVPSNDSVLAVSRSGWLLEFAGSGKTEFHPANDAHALECETGKILLIHPPQESAVTLVEKAYSPWRTWATGDRPPMMWRRGRDPAQFSPDGRLLLYRIPDENGMAPGIWIYDLETGRRDMVASPGLTESTWLKFSPRGDRAMWIVQAGPEDERRLWVLDITSRTVKCVARSAGAHGPHFAQWFGNDHLMLSVMLGGPPMTMITRVRWDGADWEEVFPNRRKLTQTEVDLFMCLPASSGTGESEGLQ